MSQIANFYTINNTEFVALEGNSDPFEAVREIKNYLSFQSTHEGLRFVLAKGRSNGESNLINEIFYPESQIGGPSQYVFPDADEAREFRDVTDDIDFDGYFDRPPVAYLTPEKVKQISSLLNNIGNEEISEQFDYKELNREGIYPCCWNDDKEENQAFNKKHFLQDYQALKDLFNHASATNSYLLCFVG
ncbi:DUF1877 family protein [Pinibacter aurantiacus]|uniref:YfbM family protein n=1 Tax=Pinibacter aurantiacus TaxID=2851599 RepID=A0A9E2S9Z0_9BACT|nr:DUF1877 family protein [Pinibacter aurantiacus]MBV4357598.1 YfbM family protein [Pinibacter aurantiacus]